ncbi:MAG: LysR family transcriptional regulator [Candidatus Thorarchaeota archaeon]|nr:MAG: LysR family transcriptional regulator [Candidatus Thorarchaeota archaeon]
MSGARMYKEKFRPNWKLWLEYKNEYVFGPGAFAILKSIQKAGTITEGAKALGMSYRYAWGVVRGIEEKLGERLLDTRKGGAIGGGGAVVTVLGIKLMELYSKVQNDFERVVQESR